MGILVYCTIHFKPFNLNTNKEINIFINFLKVKLLIFYSSFRMNERLLMIEQMSVFID